MRKRRESGNLKSEVLAALWSSKRPLTAGEVMVALGGDLAYNTVQTILTRLHDKGAVSRAQTGRAHCYSPLLDEAGLAAQKMRSALDRCPDHVTVLCRFLEAFSLQEEAALGELLRELRDLLEKVGIDAGRRL